MWAGFLLAPVPHVAEGDGEIAVSFCGAGGVGEALVVMEDLGQGTLPIRSILWLWGWWHEVEIGKWEKRVVYFYKFPANPTTVDAAIKGHSKAWLNATLFRHG